MADSSQVPRIRHANPRDAGAIAGLYCQVYPAAVRPGDGYPFPQFMDSDWIARALCTEELHWLVAEAGGELIACLGAAPDIGMDDTDDRVAELTGLIVAEAWRRRGVARTLMQSMCEYLDPRAFFVLAETRTANPGGWKVVKRAGFIPIGFEPAAHKVLGKHEAMLVMGKISPRAATQRKLGYETSRAVHGLGRVCLRRLKLGTGKPADITAYPVKAAFRSRRITSQDAVLELEGFHFRTTSEDIASLRRPGGSHDSGVVGLRRLEGVDPMGSRFVNRCFVASSRGSELGIARVSVDLEDLRARVLYLETSFNGLQGLFLARIIEALKGDQALKGLVTVVVDVRADFPALHGSLESLGFFPTVFYPALIEGHSGRIDAVQFTHMFPDASRWRWERSLDLDTDGLEVMKTVRAIVQAVAE